MLGKDDWLPCRTPFLMKIDRKAAESRPLVTTAFSRNRLMQYDPCFLSAEFYWLFYFFSAELNCLYHSAVFVAYISIYCTVFSS